MDKRFVVYALCGTAVDWIEWVKMGSAETKDGAKKIGECCGWKCWGIRLNTVPAPNYIGEDDGKWVR